MGMSSEAALVPAVDSVRPSPLLISFSFFVDADRAHLQAHPSKSRIDDFEPRRRLSASRATPSESLFPADINHDAISQHILQLNTCNGCSSYLWKPINA